MQIEIVQGDLLEQDVDVIVNAANTHLRHMGGLAGAIAKAAGPELEADSLQIRPIAQGAAGITRAGKLPFKAVVHAVGPIWQGGSFGEMESLRSAYQSAIKMGFTAVSNAAGPPTEWSIGLPAISGGIFRFPIDLLAPIAIHALTDPMLARWVTNCSIKIVVMDEGHFEAFEQALNATQWVAAA